jgi:hypothetical protein
MKKDDSRGLPVDAFYEKVRMLLPPSKYSMFALITSTGKTTGMPSDDTWGVYLRAKDTKTGSSLIDAYSVGECIGTFKAADVKDVLAAPLEDLPTYLGISPVISAIAAERMRQA